MSKLSREILLERMLARLQRDLEGRGGERDRQRRRQILRGARAATYCLGGCPPMTIAEFESVLRSELSLESVPLRHVNEVEDDD